MKSEEIIERQNEATGCYELIRVDSRTGMKVLLSTCSIGVEERILQWWRNAVKATLGLPAPVGA